VVLRSEQVAGWVTFADSVLRSAPRVADLFALTRLDPTLSNYLDLDVLYNPNVGTQAEYS
jgi:hypothetical protein